MLHFSLQAKAGADPNAPEMSGLRVQEEPSFSFGQELVRVNPVDAPAGAADGNSRLDRVSLQPPGYTQSSGQPGQKKQAQQLLSRRARQPLPASRRAGIQHPPHHRAGRGLPAGQHYSLAHRL